MNEKNQAICNLMDMPGPSLGIDLDGCVDEAPIFFNLLTNNWPGKVYVITYRNDKQKAEQVLTKYHIRWDEIFLVSSFGEKAQIINEKGILTYFDDQPEMLKKVSHLCNVMLVRNEGNFDFDEKKWVLSKDTGRLI